jgi:hypothetical protein
MRSQANRSCLVEPSKRLLQDRKDNEVIGALWGVQRTMRDKKAGSRSRYQPYQ